MTTKKITLTPGGGRETREVLKCRGEILGGVKGKTTGQKTEDRGEITGTTIVVTTGVTMAMTTGGMITDMTTEGETMKGIDTPLIG